MSIDYAIKNKTARAKLLALMFDLRWHSWREMRPIAGVRYGARLLELKRQGYLFASFDAQGEGNGKVYQLLSRTPSTAQGKMVKVYLLEQDAELVCNGMFNERIRVVVSDALGSFRINKHKL